MYLQRIWKTKVLASSPNALTNPETALSVSSPAVRMALGLSMTAAVLTKPDRIPPGEEHSWLLLLRNSRERHKHGWHCVKQPSSDEMRDGITWAEAREAETRFFAETDPWASLDAFVRGRLGTVPLTKALGEILFALIAKR